MSWRWSLLSPGRFNQSYAEQAHLARSLGLLLVEGDDLIVSDGQLFVRTIQGLKRVDGLWRWMDSRFLDPYRAGRSCHPLLPFAEWYECQPAIGHLGAVLKAGCRDAHAARQMGFVPTHGIGPALAMAHGRADRPLRIGYLLSPPYFPLRVAPD